MNIPNSGLYSRELIMPGEKRKSSEEEREGEGFGPQHSVQDENRSLSQARKILRARKAVGLADNENYNLMPDDTSLIKCLVAAGYYVKKKDKENILIEDQAIFSKKLKNDLSSKFPEQIEKMLDTLTDWLNDETFLIKCLRPTKTGTLCTSARSPMQVKSISFITKHLHYN